MFPSQKAASFHFNTGHGANVRNKSIQRMNEQTPQQIIQTFNPVTFLNVKNHDKRQDELKKRGHSTSYPNLRTLQSVSSNNLVSKRYLISALNGGSQSDNTLAFSLTINPQPNQQARYLCIQAFQHTVLNLIEITNQSASQISSHITLQCDQLAGYINQNGVDTKAIAYAWLQPQSVMPGSTFNGVNAMWKMGKEAAWDITGVNNLSFRIKTHSSNGAYTVRFPSARAFLVAMQVGSVII